MDNLNISHDFMNNFFFSKYVKKMLCFGIKHNSESLFGVVNFVNNIVVA